MMVCRNQLTSSATQRSKDLDQHLMEAFSSAGTVDRARGLLNVWVLQSLGTVDSF